MIKFIVIAAAFASSLALANQQQPIYANDALSSSAAEGNVFVSSHQVNPMFGNQRMPETIIGKDYTSCPTSKMSIGMMPSHSKGNYSGRNNSIAMGVTLDMPLDWEGALTRCEDHQKAQVIRMETENITNIVSACMEVKRQGFVLDPKVIPWAKYCKGIVHEHPSASYLKAQNDMLRNRVDHVEKHHFGKAKTTAGHKP